MPAAENFMSEWFAKARLWSTGIKALYSFENASSVCQYGGCNDTEALNYNPNATDDDICFYLGCTYSSATNYSPAANADDGSCEFNISNPCPTDINQDGITASSDILQLLAAFGDPCVQ